MLIFGQDTWAFVPLFCSVEMGIVLHCVGLAPNLGEIGCYKKDRIKKHYQSCKSMAQSNKIL